MKQLRYLQFIPAAAGLKPSVVFALLLGACLLTVLDQKRPEASESETPAATSTGGVVDVEVENGGRQVDPRQSGFARFENTDSAEVPPSSTPPSSTVVSVIPDANGDPLITKAYRLKYVPAADFTNTLSNMFRPPQNITTALDRRTNSLIVQTDPKCHEQIERLLKILDVDVPDNQIVAESALHHSRNTISRDQSDAEIALEKQVQELSAKLKQLAATADGPASPDPASGNQQADQLAKLLKDAVEKSFNERQRQQLAEIERLTTRLNRLAKSVQQREAEREQIVSRKIDELLGVSSTQKSTTVLDSVDRQGIAALYIEIMYFHAPYAESCQRMKPEMEAIAAEAVPVEVIDITADVELAREFKISSVPTVLILKGGKVVSRFTGFLNRKDLARHIRSVLKDHREEMTLSSSEWSPPENPNPGEILKEAKADTAAQHYPVALSKYVWYFENALKYDPAQTGVRLSFALNDWMALAAHYPPALDALRSQREVAFRRYKPGSVDPHLFMEIVAFNRVLNDDELTKEMFEILAQNHPTTATLVFAFVRPSLVKVKAYTLCGKFLNPQQDLERLRQMRQLQSQLHRDKQQDPLFDMSILGTRTFAQEAATLVALLVLNDRKPEAESIAAEAKSEIADAKFHSCIDAALTGTLPDGI